MIKELVLKNRSYRRFYEDKKISMDTLKELVEIAHNTPSAANKQPLRYKLVNDETGNDKVFECLGWAGYFKDWDGPLKGERPTGYVIMITKSGANSSWDEGIAGQTMLLAATQMGMGGCFIGNVDREKLAKIIELPQDMIIKLVIAFGYPKEEVVLEEILSDGDYKYYRDENQVHHVPKVKVEDIVI
ncbi:nitroreductase family protein [[Clostridium] fimetarium]|uniref:Nitroreductase n=1 Tax=[Clostridium] fimetarium TaxID=99656 RepID=A0A1I0QA13_9FIRM|nr:nitroreductase family protein [[Clostridium] fimetarium]SEW23838.1 Nitroreductase [[Clostridium] fimetarium]